MDTFFFILSKLVWALLSPINLLVFLLMFASILLIFNQTKWAKRLLIPTALGGFLIMAFPVGDYLMQPLESRFSQPSQMPDKVDGIIQLGGGEDLRRILSWPHNELGNEMGIGADRYLATKYLADLYPNAKVIFSGGSGSVQLQNLGSEGQIAKKTLKILGISPDRLVIESNSRNTYENFKNILPLLPNPQGRYLLITSAFHMPRSVGIARQQGIEVIPFPVDFRSNSYALRQMDFDLFDHLKSLQPAWREWIGLTVYYWTGKTDNWLPEEEIK